jgi:hypothetical protein
MATLTRTDIDRDGLELEALLASAASGGDEFQNDGKRTFAVVKNVNAADRTITFVTQKTVDGEAIDDKTVVVSQDEIMLVGPFPADVYNDENDRVQMTYSSETDVSVAAVRL